MRKELQALLEDLEADRVVDHHGIAHRLRRILEAPVAAEVPSCCHRHPFQDEPDVAVVGKNPEANGVDPEYEAALADQYVPGAYEPEE